MPGRAAKIIITERQQAALESMTRSSTCGQGIAQRARMILLAFEGFDNEVIAERIGCERHTVGVWRRRWAKGFEQLVLVECCEKDSVLPVALADFLRDEPRSGCGGKFTAEQVTQILAVACEPPEQSGRPVAHWTPRELADEAVKRGIVASISARQVGRYLKDGRPQAALEPVLAQRRSEGSRGVRRSGAGRLRLLSGSSRGAPPRSAYRERGRDDRHPGAGADRADEAHAAGAGGATRV